LFVVATAAVLALGAVVVFANDLDRYRRNVGRSLRLILERCCDRPGILLNSESLYEGTLGFSLDWSIQAFDSVGTDRVEELPTCEGISKMKAALIGIIHVASSEVVSYELPQSWP